MGKKSLEQVVKEHADFGFERSLIEIAYANVDGDSSRVMDEIFRLQQESQVFPTVPSAPRRSRRTRTTRTRS